MKNTIALCFTVILLPISPSSQNTTTSSTSISPSDQLHEMPYLRRGQELLVTDKPTLKEYVSWVFIDPTKTRTLLNGQLTYETENNFRKEFLDCQRELQVVEEYTKDCFMTPSFKYRETISEKAITIAHNKGLSYLTKKLGLLWLKLIVEIGELCDEKFKLERDKEFTQRTKNNSLHSYSDIDDPMGEIASIFGIQTTQKLTHSNKMALDYQQFLIMNGHREKLYPLLTNLFYQIDPEELHRLFPNKAIKKVD